MCVVRTSVCVDAYEKYTGIIIILALTTLCNENTNTCNIQIVLFLYRVMPL